MIRLSSFASLIRRARGLYVVLIASSFIGCTSITRDTQAPSFALADLRPLDATLVEQRFLIGLRVTNPNDHPIRVRGGDAQFEVNGIPFATGVTDQDTKLKPFSEEIVYVTATTNLSKVMQQIGKIAQQRALSYRLKGSLKLDNLPVPIPFDEGGDISLERLMNLAGMGTSTEI